jgi:mono/diheme cytochrome c family protein
VTPAAAARSRLPYMLGAVMWGTLMAVVLTAGGPTSTAAPPAEAPADLAARGAELYAFNCSTCHGATGGGFDEARAAFPDDHRDCVRCHGPRNPAVMTPHEISIYQTAFSLGEAPPLTDAEALARYGTAGALYRSIRATMPRWYPGRLSDEEYRAITAHVLRLSGLWPSGATDDPDGLDDVPLRVEEP